MAITLGNTPDDLTVEVTKDSAFVCTLQAFDASNIATNFPTGTTVYIVLSSGRWDATIAGNEATFFRTATQVNTTIAWGKKQVATLFYENGTTKLVWAKGKLDVTA